MKLFLKVHSIIAAVLSNQEKLSKSLVILDQTEFFTFITSVNLKIQIFSSIKLSRHLGVNIKPWCERNKKMCGKIVPYEQNNNLNYPIEMTSTHCTPLDQGLCLEYLSELNLCLSWFLN